MLVSFILRMRISIESAASRRYQSRRKQSEQSDEGIGHTFVSGVS
jgi:hypothetical protein